MIIMGYEVMIWEQDQTVFEVSVCGDYICDLYIRS